MRAGRARQLALAVLLPAVAVLTTSCSGSQSTCDGVRSVSDFVSQFSQGLDNFAEYRYAQLRLDTLDALETARSTLKDDKYGDEAAKLVGRLQAFVKAMDDVSWDVSQALESEAAVEAASALGTAEALSEANAVEVVVIAKCGLPTTIPPIVGSDTLPFPQVQPPTATDPPTNGPNEDSEFRASGQMVATQFGLTLSDLQVVCLGRELENAFTDNTSDPDPAQTQSTYQGAFDRCSINFKVPRD